jgi:hypothetical protein
MRNWFEIRGLKAKYHHIKAGLFFIVLVLNMSALGLCAQVSTGKPKVAGEIGGPMSLRLPSGPNRPGRFGAYYTKLDYSQVWDKPWRVGEHADVVVQFDSGAHKFVFWRGTSYIPCWVTDADVWYTNEFVERRGHHSPNTRGCVEPMSDKQCRFSNVRIIENNEARVVVHWRYAPVDVGYNHPFIDPLTGWGDWVDEYYTIYPNAIGVRKITVHTTQPGMWTEYQEAIVVNQPGTMPDDNIERGAVSVANMEGKSKTYYWDEDGGPEFLENPPGANILKVNLKGTLKPFALVSPPEGDGDLITSYEGHGRGSNFNWWDHWPVSQTASDGRRATSAEKPSHSSLCHIGLPGVATAEWKHYAAGNNWRTKIMLQGLTEKSVEELVPLAKSWLNPAELKLSQSGAFTSKDFDPTQKAYCLDCKDKSESTPLSFELKGSSDSPVIDPAFVINNWGRRDVELKVNGRNIQKGADARWDYQENIDGCALVIWLKAEYQKPVSVSISPVMNAR